jgi:hypothetical protein
VALRGRMDLGFGGGEPGGAGTAELARFHVIEPVPHHEQMAETATDRTFTSVSIG